MSSYASREIHGGEPPAGERATRSSVVRCSASVLRPLFCLLFIFLGCIPALASLDPRKAITTYVHTQWRAAQGLPQSSVIAIAQTQNGYLWLGTEEGLARFDGSRFVVFDKRTPGLLSNSISVLLRDSKQNLWIGTNGGGLSRYADGKFTNYKTGKGLPNDSIRCLYEGGDGALWIGTDGGGLVRFQNGAFTTFSKADGLPDPAVFSIAGGKNGSFWVGTHGGLARFSEGTLHPFPFSGAWVHEAIEATLTDSNGTLWVGTESDGLYRVDADGVVRYDTKDGLASNQVIALYQDGARTIWVGTLAGGLNRFVNGKFSTYLEADGLAGRDVWTIQEDAEGSLWIGTAGGGLDSLRNSSVATLGVKDGLASDVILPVFEDNGGALWLGSLQGLTKWKDGKATIYTQKDGLPDTRVFSIAQDGGGRIWVSTRQGLARMENGHFTPFRGMQGQPTGLFLCMLTDRHGDLWFGSRAGLTHLTGDKFVTYSTRDGLASNFVSALYEAPDGSFWIGTGSGGLSRFKNGRFTTYDTRNGLSSNIILSLSGDPDGTVWIGTNGGGLNRFRNGKFVSYTSNGGLWSDSIFRVLDDGMGRLWMSSNKGIFSVDRQELEAYADRRIGSIHCSSYGTNDGMQSRECNGGFQPAGWRTRDGRLCFPTMKGLAIVDPSSLVKNKLPQPILEKVAANDRTLQLDRPLLVPPGKGKLEFQFTAPTFIAPERLRFRYMLEGFDKDWTDTEDRRTAYYTNIPHGEYRFRVILGMNNAWSTSGPVVNLTIKPHYYQTKLFYFFIAITSLSLLAGFYRLRVRQLKRREQTLVVLVNERTSALQESESQLRRSRDELELRVRERTSELVHTNWALEAEVAERKRAEEQLTHAKDAAEAANRAKSDFLANMSHEIRTPINGILGMSDIALSTELSEELREYLEIIKLSGDSLLAIVNDILDFSKIEARKLALDLVPFEIGSSVSELIRSLAIRARQKGLSLTWQIDDAIPKLLIGDPLRLRQILLNLLDNAIKFTAQGSVSLSVSVESVQPNEVILHFAVKDTGIGISPEKQKTVFEAFSQADNSSTRRYGGTGLGLTISSQLAALMDGRLWVESSLGSGSTFHFLACFDRPAASPDAEKLADVPALTNA